MQRQIRVQDSQNKAEEAVGDVLHDFKLSASPVNTRTYCKTTHRAAATCSNTDI